MSEPLFVPGEIALSRVTWRCHCGCVGIHVAQEVMIQGLIPPHMRPLGVGDVHCYWLDLGHTHDGQRVGIVEWQLKKKDGNDPSVFDDKIWNPLKEKVPT